MGRFEHARITSSIDSEGWAGLPGTTDAHESDSDREALHSACVQGESPLHTACRCGLAGLTAELLQQGANPNLQTQKPLPEDASGVAMQSPLHMAIAHNHPDVVSVILEQKGQLLSIFCVRIVQLCEPQLLTLSSVDLLQPMLFMPPTTSRSFQTSV